MLEQELVIYCWITLHNNETVYQHRKIDTFPVPLKNRPLNKPDSPKGKRREENKIKSTHLIFFLKCKHCVKNCALH